MSDDTGRDRALESASESRATHPSVERDLWVYLSALLLAVPLIEAPNLTSFLLSRVVPVGAARVLVIWVVEAVLLIAWLEGVRLVLRREWPRWVLLIVPVVAFLLEVALIALGTYLLR